MVIELINNSNNYSNGSCSCSNSSNSRRKVLKIVLVILMIVISAIVVVIARVIPDLSDYASYIIDNSRKGNQLKYALQEAAVAQKVRDSGYDAVIGHSKGKKGPFISEVFDIRESHYPNQYGDFQLNPKFEEMYQNTPTRKELIQQQIDKIE
jgi:hypothetical protein